MTNTLLPFDPKLAKSELNPDGLEVVSHRNEGGASHYEIVLSIDDKEYGRGEGGSKKIAEQKAAKQANDALFK